LARDEFKTLLAEALSRALTNHRFELFAFVFMPEHVHLLVQPHAESGSIAALLGAIKRPMSVRARRMLEVSADPLVRALMNGKPSTFRFWQQGPGYDSNLRSWEAVGDVIDYIHMNPVRRGLVERPEQYDWSSCRQWSSSGDGALPYLPCVTRIKS